MRKLLKTITLLMLLSLSIFSANSEENTLLGKLDIEMKQSKLLDSCPAKLYQPPQQKFTGDYVFCKDNPQTCFNACQKGDANKCFALGYSLQQKKEIDEKYAEFLFAKSCQQGLPLGCTNRAAHLNMFSTIEADKVCALETFKQSCELNDSWGCVMYGFILSENEGDLELTKKVLKKTCDIKVNSESCVAAKNVLKNIEKMEKSTDSKE